MQKYKIVKTIGDGSFGVVFKAIAPNNDIVAIKKMKTKYKTWEDCNGLREIKSLKKFEHPNIIKLHQVILANSELYLVFDYLDSNLYEVYTRALESNRSLTENEIKSIFFKIATGLAYLHKNGYFHRDLKPENILCHNNEVKLCDFGLARQIRSRPPFTEYVSTRWYRAPELLLHGSYNSPVDIFALAAIVVQLYLKAPLFPGQTEVETMNKIVEVLGTPTRNEWPEGHKMASTINYNFPQQKKKELSDIIPNASPDAIDLLQSMFAYSSRKRPSASEYVVDYKRILKHPFFESIHSGQQKPSEVKYQTKFSFYEKNIIEIPANLPMENNKEMDMRKSQIKFGTSFGSTFRSSKQEKKSQLDFITEVKEEKSSSKKYRKGPEHDQIAKKFDQMEEILMELQQKKQKDKQKEDRRKEDIYVPESKPEFISGKTEHPQTDFKMPVFTFGGIGTSSFSTLGSIKNVKSPLFLKAKPGESK